MNRKSVPKILKELAGVNPDAVATERALERAKSALTSKPQLSVRAQIMRPRNLAAIAAAIAIVVVLTQLVPSTGNANFAFAQVQEQVAKTRSVQFIATCKSHGLAAPYEVEETRKVQILGSQLKREEVSGKSFSWRGTQLPFDAKATHYVSIFDSNRKEYLSLNPGNEEFVRGSFSGSLSDESYLLSPTIGEGPVKQPPEITLSWRYARYKFRPETDIYRLIQQIPRESAKQLPEKILNGRSVVGFVVEQPMPMQASDARKEDTASMTHIWWVDVETRLPVQLQVAYKSTYAFSNNHTWTVTDIEFDAPLDSTLFALDPPAGYREVQWFREEKLVSRELAGPRIKRTEFVFADVQEEVANTKSIQYTETWSQTAPDGKKYSPLVGHVKILGNGLKGEEQELGAGGDIQVSLSPFGRPTEITDLDRQKKAALYPEVKGYLAMDWKGTFAGAYSVPEKEAKSPPADLSQKKSDDGKGKVSSSEGYATGKVTVGQWDWSKAVAAPKLDIFELIRNVPIEKAKRLDEKTIGDKRTIGFLVETNDAGSSTWRHTWWVDPSTKLPVQLEIEFSDKPPGVGGFTRVVSDIRFNEPLDEKLFSVDLPDGYTDLAPILKADAEEREKEYKQPNRMNSLQFRQTQNMKMKDGRRAPELVKHVTLLDGYLRRDEIEIKPTVETQPALAANIKPSVMLFDAKVKKALVLLPDSNRFLDPMKTNFTADYLQAALNERSPLDLLQTNGKMNPYADVNMFYRGFEWLPLTTVEGKSLLGRRTTETKNRGQFTDTTERTFWERPGVSLPVRVEETFRSTDPELPDVDVLITDFVQSAPVDRKMFSFDPPEGYMELAAKKSEDSVKPNAN